MTTIPESASNHSQQQQQQRRKQQLQHSAAAAVPLSGWSFTPFNVLLTAGRISMSVYKHVEEERVTPDATGATAKRKRSIRKSDLEAPAELLKVKGHKAAAERSRSALDECSTLDSGLPEPDVTVIRKMAPVLYMYFSQPHSLLSLERRAQKLELSCYDLVLKGAKPGYTMLDMGGNYIPEPLDYTVHWIDTKPGRPDDKTGIPPSLYTFRVSDFLSGGAAASLVLARPLRLNLGIAKLEALLTLLQDAWRSIAPSLRSMTSAADDGGLDEAPTDDAADAAAAAESVAADGDQQQSGTLRAYLAHMDELRVSTVQLLVVLETVPCAQQPLLQLSCAAVDARLDFVADRSKGTTQRCLALQPQCA